MESFVDIIVTVDAYAMISILEQARDKTGGHESHSCGLSIDTVLTLSCLRENP